MVAVDREQRPVLEEIESVVAPLALGHLPAVNIEDGLQLPAVESDGGRRLGANLLMRHVIGGNDIEAHGAPRLSRLFGQSELPCYTIVMIAAIGPSCKRLDAHWQTGHRFCCSEASAKTKLPPP